jgi:hypothetical protein
MGSGVSWNTGHRSVAEQWWLQLGGLPAAKYAPAVAIDLNHCHYPHEDGYVLYGEWNTTVNLKIHPEFHNISLWRGRLRLLA